MATEVLQVRITASGGAQVQRESQKARSGLAGMEGSAKKAQSAFVTSAKSILRFTAISAGIGSAAVAIKNIATTTIGFDKAMRNVNSIAQLSEQQFEDLRQGVLKLAGPTAQSPVTLAQGMYDLVSSGFDAADSLKIVESAARAATAGLTTTDVSTKAVAAVLNAYRKPASAAASVSDTLFETVNRGVISFDELASNIGTVLPFAASAGISLREVGASISTMTKQGIGGANAITFLKNAYVAFNKPSADLNKAIKATGFESGEALIKSKGFQGALESVIGTTDGSRKAVAALFPNIRALTAVLALTGGNAKEAGKDIKGMSRDSGATSRVLAEQSKSISFQWNKLKAEASVLAIQVGDKLKPALASALGGISGFLAGLGNGDSAVRRFMASVVQAPIVVNAFNLIKNAIMGVVGVAKFLLNVGQSVASMLSPVTSLAGKFLQSEAAVRVFNAALGALAGLLAANLARAAAWLGILAVAKVIAFANAIRNAGSAMVALRVAMATNPFGLLLAGIGLVAGALGVFGGKSKEAAVSQQELAGAIQQTRDAIDRLNDADLEHAQLVLNAARAETGLEEALKNRRTLAASGTATALQEKQADLAVKQARLDLTRETQRLNRSERDRSSTRRKDSADATASLEPLRKRREQIRGEINDIKDQIKAQQQQRTRIHKGGGDTGSIDKAIARDRERLADKTNELKQQERELRAEQNRLKSAMEGAGPAARSLARRYADFPKAVKTILKTEDAGALRSLKNLSGKLEGVGRKRTVARILASSATAEQAIGRLKRLLDSIKSKNVKVTVTESIKRLNLNQPGHKTKTDRSALVPGGARGMKITSPMAIVGEEAPRHPEFVIATNPRYRQRNVGLLGAAGKALGVPGFAQGGVVSVPQIQKAVEREIWRAPMLAEGGVLHQVPLKIDLTQIGLKAFGKADYPDYSVQVDAPRAPGGAGGGGDPGKWQGGTLAFAAALSKIFGLTISSTWRSPSHNRAVGGVPNSMHTHGSLANPGAIDFLPPSAAAANYARQAGVPEVLIHDAGSGLHLHLGFFKRGGVLADLLPAFKKGGVSGQAKAQASGGGIRDQMQRIWKVADRYYWADGESMPKIRFPKHAPKSKWLKDALAWFSPDKNVVSFTPSAQRQFRRGDDYAESTLLHEWAHVFQKGGLKTWEAEGGAEAFAQKFDNAIFRKAHVPFKDSALAYPGFVGRVEVARGPDWIAKGQFVGDPFPRGGGDVFAKQEKPKAKGGISATASAKHDPNKLYPRHSLANAAGHVRFTPGEVVDVARSAGLPGRPFEQIAHGESQYYPGIVSFDGGYGFWQMTPKAGGWGAKWLKKLSSLGGIDQMLNPTKNAKMAKVLFDDSGYGPWVGTKFLTARPLDKKGKPAPKTDRKKEGKTQRKHKKPSGRAGSRRPLEIPEAVTALDKLWDSGYGEKIQVYDNLKRQLDASPLSAQEIQEIMGATGATRDELEGPQLSQPEINRLVGEQESILEFLKTQVTKAADRARGALLAAIKLLVKLTNETNEQIAHETAVIKRRADELAGLKAHKKKSEKEQAGRKNPSKSLERSIASDDEKITKIERDVTNRKERRTRLEGRVDTYKTKRDEFSTTFGTIYDRQTKYSAGDSIKQAIDDTVFNIGELKGTKPPGADVTGKDGNVDDELVGLLKQQLQDVRRDLAAQRAQTPAFAGVFHQGGDIPGTGEKMALVRGGERVQTAAQKNQRPQVNVAINVNGDRALAAALRDAIDVVVVEAADQIGAKAASGSRTPVAGRLARFGS